MIYVGIDIAKLNHFAAAIFFRRPKYSSEPFKFSPTNYDGFYLLLSHLFHIDHEDIITGLESTGTLLVTTLFVFLITRGFEVCVLKPLSRIPVHA